MCSEWIFGRICLFIFSICSGENVSCWLETMFWRDPGQIPIWMHWCRFFYSFFFYKCEKVFARNKNEQGTMCDWVVESVYTTIHFSTTLTHSWYYKRLKGVKGVRKINQVCVNVLKVCVKFPTGAENRLTDPENSVTQVSVWRSSSISEVLH